MKKALFILLTLLCFNYSCNKCRDREFQGYNPLVVQAIPINHQQKFKFATSELDTFELVANREDLLITPDIPLVCEEVLNIELEEDGNRFPVMIFLHRGSGNPKDFIQIQIHSKRDNHGNIIQIQVNEDGSMEPKIFGIQNPSPYTIHSEIEINDVMYRELLEINYGDRERADGIVNIKYNKEKGVVQYETKDGLITTLIE